MIACICGSVIGTLIGILGSFYICKWQYDRELKKLQKLIEEANTLKITIKNEI